MTRILASEFLTVLDPDSFIRWDTPPKYGEIDQEYADALTRANSKAEFDESIITGEGLINGSPIAVIVFDFTFMGGSLGAVASTRIMQAVHRATKQKLPLLVSPASGGARMQEDNRATVMMLTITSAVQRHRHANLPFIVYLRDPTMGGAMATVGSLGHITFAQPGASIGFLGPRVVGVITGSKLPDGVQQAENLAEHGIVDRVMPFEQLRNEMVKIVRILAPATPGGYIETPKPTQKLNLLETIEVTRDPTRPGSFELMEELGDGVVKLSGAPGATVAIARIHGRACVLIAQDRRHTLTTQALRLARHGASLACELALPLVSIVDTPGAELSQAAEEQGMVGSIARTIATLVDAPLPSVTIILGQGVGAGALAMLPGNLVYAAETAWLSALPFEGASAILYNDADHAAEILERQGVLARSLVEMKLIDGLIAETDNFLQNVLATISNALSELETNPERAGREARFARFEELAQPNL
ncbi:hypothetical protein CDES_04185 [Corynebacterium deserti GIMN1.010]|uniref:Uncharacterized protein n=1 Tax=Corynebacterium deserti GIMN1.010 TaxID=931089 RepID=A0A0M3Q999_9CORY|nr:carboxyl transferase domain-containing protein [Corynebacterium deserti]ALC05283.1 hypothetical protein CDES_04185 [Corynebacterium deserti GIMN1.010]